MASVQGDSLGESQASPRCSSLPLKKEALGFSPSVQPSERGCLPPPLCPPWPAFGFCSTLLLLTAVQPDDLGQAVGAHKQVQRDGHSAPLDVLKAGGRRRARRVRFHLPAGRWVLEQGAGRRRRRWWVLGGSRAQRSDRRGRGAPSSRSSSAAASTSHTRRAGLKARRLVATTTSSSSCAAAAKPPRQWRRRGLPLLPLVLAAPAGPGNTIPAPPD